VKTTSINSNSDASRQSSRVSAGAKGQYEEDHPDLAHLEQRLNEEVDEDFFDDPRKFHTLGRVIDVLGMQLADDLAIGAERHMMDATERNPAYKALKDQQSVVEHAIEHLAMIHCADLNGSVVQVGRVARQFNDAVSKVRSLRKQVLEIQETLGAQSQPTLPNGAPNTAGGGGPAGVHSTGASAAASAMSLRELWLKKLECEAVLSLLNKLDKIRAAPRQFDLYIRANRIGAAVLGLASALDTMFSDDIAQVQALHKIMEQLMLRKQRAEEVVWEILADVLFLRTGNGMGVLLAETTDKAKNRGIGSGASLTAGSGAGGTGMSTNNSIVSNESKTKQRALIRNILTSNLDSADPKSNMRNPFVTKTMRFALDDDLNDLDGDGHDDMYDDQHLEDDEEDDDEAIKHPSASGSNDEGAMIPMRSSISHAPIRRPLVIPVSMIEAEFDLDADERRCLEELALVAGNSRVHQRPRYADPTVALRTLVECLAQLRRLDDVERILQDILEKEIKKLVQREQIRTFCRLERLGKMKGGRYSIMSRSSQHADLRELRRHLNGILSAFGCVMLRLAHFAQILRYRVTQEKSTAYSSPSSAMQSVLLTAKGIMEREVKGFVRACLNESARTPTGPMGDSAATAKGRGMTSHESGLFSMGIIDREKKSNSRVDNMTSNASKSAIAQLTTQRFVSDILFPKTNNNPQIRHALYFRKPVSKWTSNVQLLRKELSSVTGEDTSAPSYSNEVEEPAVDFLDNLIKKDLLPVLQEEAVDGTVRALERPDAFDPVLDRNVYARTNSNEPQDVDMCKACDALYTSTGPLFLALHRLPRGGEMYLPLVAVLEHVILTFISRVKQQVNKLCSNKTALKLLMDSGSSSGGNQTSFGQCMERRKAFAQLVLAYADGDLLEVSEEAVARESGLVPPLTPPSADTPRSGSDINRSNIPGMEDLDLVGGVDREEHNLAQELQFMKPFLEFATAKQSKIVICSDEELMKSACLAHSLMKLSSLLESRLKVRTNLGANKMLTSTRALREAIKSIKANGLKMAKFCRGDIMMQTITRLSKVCTSSTIVARDAVRIPSSVNDLGEYMTAASDNLREAAGNAVTAYSFSSLEQYIPLCLIQTVRVLAAGEGIITRAPLSMNGIESLDRSGSVLYRDLKGATSFDNSFWDIELAAVSFERSASFMAMMELEMSELEAYYQANHEDFSAADFQLMFAMDGPRRQGDIGRYHMLQRRLENVT